MERITPDRAILELVNHTDYFRLLTGKYKCGGGLKKKIKVEYDNYPYYFYYARHHEGIPVYILYSKENSECVIFLIDTKEQEALIENINADYEGCMNGSKLLEIAIKFLKENKKHFNLKRIALQDRSLKHCGRYRVRFSDFYMLTHSIPWYVKYGFLPYDQVARINNQKNIIDKEKMKILINNQKILKKLKVGNVKKLYSYIKKYAPEGYDLIKIKKTLEDGKNEKFMYFMEWFMSDLTKINCEIYAQINNKIMKDIGIETLHNTVYFMKI